jgi:hypothetical protein
VQRADRTGGRARARTRGGGQQQSGTVLRRPLPLPLTSAGHCDKDSRAPAGICWLGTCSATLPRVHPAAWTPQFSTAITELFVGLSNSTLLLFGYMGPSQFRTSCQLSHRTTLIGDASRSRSPRSIVSEAFLPFPQNHGFLIVNRPSANVGHTHRPAPQLSIASQPLDMIRCSLKAYTRL